MYKGLPEDVSNALSLLWEYAEDGYSGIAGEFESEKYGLEWDKEKKAYVFTVVFYV